MIKSTKGLKRVLALILCAVMMLGLMPAVSAGNVVPGSDAKQVSIDAAAEGAVLLENEGTLPLDEETSVAVFGRSQIDMVQGGTGSGWVYTNISYNFIDGFDAAGINYDKDLYNVYKTWCEDLENEIATSGVASVSASNPEMPLTTAVVDAAAAKSDVAIVFIGRNSGEGEDHEEAKGDWYLQDGEKDMLDQVNNAFDEVVIILNIGALIDLTWVDDYNNISAILNAWQPGSYGALAIGDILVGNVSPSGKLADTWAYEYADYPANKYGSFGRGIQDPVYTEDIYVGYRYFETFAPDRVMYEFGYGLSYTTFEQELLGLYGNEDELTAMVRVTNTGDTYSGKDTVQVYYSAPQGKLGKPALELAAFAKTDVLAPGENQILNITYDKKDMASYDDSGVTGNKSAYVLEAGEYKIYAGSSVKELAGYVIYDIDSLVVTEQLTEALAPATDLSILTAGTYDSATGTYSVGTKTSPKRTVSLDSKYETNLPWVGLTGDKTNDIQLVDVAKGTKTADEFIAQFTLSELVQIFGGTTNITVPKAVGAAGIYGQNSILAAQGVEVSVVADGPAGLRLTMGEDQTGNTAFPIAAMLACTWNVDILEKIGESIGEEAAYNDVDGWLAPGMNIHRDPFCGRNFEYYSEDPVVSGMMAAATTKGVQSYGVTVTLKHYAGNSQETDRGGGNSIVSERAMREIYLKGFEITVKTANPGWIMSSYNQINGVQAASNYDLITQIPRNEWGYQGAYMTDWGGAKDNGNASMLRSGHELSMPGLTGFNMLRLPSTFVVEGGTFGTIYCRSCHKEYGSYIMYMIGYLPLDASQPCTDPPGGTCNRELIPSTTVEKIWQDEYVIEDGKIYLVQGATKKFICTEAEFNSDRSGIITGLMYGHVTMGEVQRGAVKLVETLTEGLRFRTIHGLAPTEYPYDDDWYTVEKEQVKLGYDRTAFIEGDGNGKFRPEDSITRAEVAAIVARTLGNYDKNWKYTTTFKDVDAKKWYATYIGCIENLELINGYGDGTFRPEEAITREELAAILARTTEVLTADGDMPFKDKDKISKWALDYVYTCFIYDWMEGDTAGTIRPTDKITRAETTAMINRVLGVGKTDADSLVNIDVESLTTFTDVDKDIWYYYHIIEAANNFTYYIKNDGSMIWLA